VTAEAKNKRTRSQSSLAQDFGRSTVFLSANEPFKWA
jgi:hypothetical protein